MYDIQTFTTPRGEKMVIVPQKDYDRLVARHDKEEDHDAGDARALLRRVAAGKEPVTPLEVYKLMRNEGMSRLRAWRTYRKLSSAALAKKIGKSQAYLTQIENGTREGSVKTLALLAKALGTTIDALAQ